MATATRILTYEEWLALPPVEDGTDEVVKGELRFMPPNHYPHAEIVQNLIDEVVFQVNKKQIRILGSALGLMISRNPLTSRSPDAVMFWRDRMEIRDGMYWSPPGLVVEVLSPSERRHQQDEKLEDYASIGVPEVWIISPEAATVEVRQLRDGKLERVSIVADGVLQPSQFPGVSLEVEKLFPA